MKKTVSALLSLVLIFSLCMPAFAGDKCSCENDPYIYVYGFGRTDYTYAAGTEDEVQVFAPENSVITQALKGNIVKLLFSMLLPWKAPFGETLTDIGEKMLEKMYCDENGESVYELTTTENIITKDHAYRTFYYYYDWRKDIKTLARELSEYIDAVLETTGHDKAALCAESMGGAVVSAYLYEYGHSKVSSLIMSSSAFMGVPLIAEGFVGNLKIDPFEVIDYVEVFLKGSLVDEANNAITLFDRLGVIGLLLSPLATSINKSIDIIYDEFLKPFFGLMPGFWCFVYGDYYETAKEFMGVKEGSIFEEKIDYYQYSVRPNIEKLLRDAMADGMKLAIVSNYGLTAPTFVENHSYNSDGLIDARLTSMGATVADKGKTLSEEYIAQKDSCFISPDKVIDASTALFPENTWFVKYAYHGVVDYYFARWVRTADEVNIAANDGYSQFLKREGGTYVPLTAENDDNRTDFVKALDDAENFFKGLFGG